ncbi:MAG: hypothetical protein AB7G93_10820 [Bdellovibrionales bacterium]
MKVLARKQFLLSERFLACSGRPLDWARFLFHFREGSKDLVVDSLKAYQNADGGFGHALEPDLRTPESSVLATSIALKLLVELGVEAENPVVRNTLDYLERTFDSERRIWLIAPEGLTKHAHAPWWGGEDLLQDFGGCLANPRAQIVGALLFYQTTFDRSILDKALDAVVTHLDRLSHTIEMHDLICYIYLFESPGLSDDLKKKMSQKLRRAVSSTISTEPEKWSGYAVKPLLFCHGPQSFLYDELKEVVNLNLDFEIQRWQDDGSWGPNWSWEEYNPEAWTAAKREWASHLTIETLLTLRNFGRIETR